MSEVDEEGDLILLTIQIKSIPRRRKEGSFFFLGFILLLRALSLPHVLANTVHIIKSENSCNIFSPLLSRKVWFHIELIDAIIYLQSKSCQEIGGNLQYHNTSKYGNVRI